MQYPHLFLDIRVAMSRERMNDEFPNHLLSDIQSLLPWKADFPCCHKGVTTKAFQQLKERANFKTKLHRIII